MPRAFDVHPHSALDRGIHRLRDRNENAALQAHEYLLRRLRLVEVAVLRNVAADRTRNCTRCNGDITTGAGADQAAEPRARHTSNDRAKALVVRALHLGQVDLLDDAGTDLGRGAAAGCRAGGIIAAARTIINALKALFISRSLQ